MIELDGMGLTAEDVYRIAVLGEKASISGAALQKIKKSRNALENKINHGDTIYGVNTGFGSLLNVRIEKEDIDKLQQNLIRSHSSGVGEPLSQEYVRAMMVIRLNSFCKGFSGVSTNLVDFTLKFLNEGITPVVPRYGSVGASGDLAPLAHVALALMGEGQVYYQGKAFETAELLRKLNIEAYKFTEKEGVAFINGTAAISSILSLEVFRSFRLMRNAIASSTLSFEGLRGTLKAFREWAVSSRGHNGQKCIAASFRDLVGDSIIIRKSTEEKVQDPYTLRCIPQVYGAVLDTINYVNSVLTTEINSATDNPLVSSEEIISAGNFHGEPVALACDFLAIALTDLGNMIERRIARITDSSLSGLPPFLVRDSGLNSGYMIPQYVAAALCNRNKTLSFPSTADSIPTSANQEDHVSMGMNAAIKLSEIVSNLFQIISIEYLTGAQALEFATDKPSTFASGIYGEIREIVPALVSDRPPYMDISRIYEMISGEKFDMEKLGAVKLK
ncbi:histidine ammonia-lyase [Thermoplasmatales archaeon]|nr:histidine ammonia-lyase [Thermoplasmatales archaeon]